jgi:hypothetical protein
MQRHPVDDTPRRAGNPNPHDLTNSKPFAIKRMLSRPERTITPRTMSGWWSQRPEIDYKDLDMTMKKQGRLARSGSEKGSVPISS